MHLAKEPGYVNTVTGNKLDDQGSTPGKGSDRYFHLHHCGRCPLSFISNRYWGTTVEVKEYMEPFLHFCTTSYLPLLSSLQTTSIIKVITNFALHKLALAMSVVLFTRHQEGTKWGLWVGLSAIPLVLKADNI
jgi:hypothetical protein